MPHGLSRRRRRNHLAQRLVLHLFLGAAWLLLAATQYESAVDDRSEIQREVQTNALNLAVSLAQHGADTFRIADAVLASLVDRLEGSATLRPAGLHAFLVSEAQRSDRVHGLFVYDADGQWITSSLPTVPTQLNNSDRAYFIHHRTRRDRAAYIGMPIRSRSDGSWIVTISRRMDNPDGSFRGVVLASIQLALLEDYYRTFDVGRDGTVGMTTVDGIVLARLPHDEANFGRSIVGTAVYRAMQATRRGTLAYTSPIDGMARIAGFATTDAYGLQILVGLSSAEAMQPWRQSVMHRLMISLLGLVLLLAAGIWLDLQLRRQHRTEALLSDEAQLDPLTQLFNRRSFDRGFAEALRLAASGGQHLSLLLVDVDHFKLYNDTYGHGGGDVCLQLVARALENGARADDIVARYGGEEFVLVLKGCDADDAAVRAQSLVDAVRALGIVHAASPTAAVVTISVGVSSCGPGRYQTAAEMLLQADQALYAAKLSGRSRWVAQARV